MRRARARRTRYLRDVVWLDEDSLPVALERAADDRPRHLGRREEAGERPALARVGAQAVRVGKAGRSAPRLVAPEEVADDDRVVPPLEQALALRLVAGKVAAPGLVH